MALQHAKKVAREGQPIPEATIKEIHHKIFETCWPDQAGRYRKVDVDAFEPIADQPPHWTAVEGEMLLFGRELEERTASAPASPAEAVVLGIWAHMELVRVHPFQEGNGKTARLLMDVILMRHVIGPKRPLVLPLAYRDRYMDAVQRARAGDSRPFEGLVADLLDRTLRREERLGPQSRQARRRRQRRRRRRGY